SEALIFAIQNKVRFLILLKLSKAHEKTTWIYFLSFGIGRFRFCQGGTSVHFFSIIWLCSKMRSQSIWDGTYVESWTKRVS
ncbi:hypothetical protein, partial [Bacteroides clarus]|uniref:hypothetical protein n=1 Tax=Bacteroides clarus TaxID=626929 RepID=UPI001E42E11A